MEVRDSKIIEENVNKMGFSLVGWEPYPEPKEPEPYDYKNDPDYIEEKCSECGTSTWVRCYCDDCFNEIQIDW